MTPTEVQDIMEQEMAAYTYLFNFFWDEHGLTLIHSEMNDIIKAVDEFKKMFNEGKNKEPLSY